MGRRSAVDIVVGIALLVCGPCAAALKMTHFGMVAVIVIWAAILLAVPGLGLLVAIATTTFFARDSAVRHVRGGVGRARVAACAVVVCTLLAGAVAPDGDGSPVPQPSFLGEMLGWDPSAYDAALSAALVLAAASAAALLWLAVEWIRGLIARSQRRRAL